MDFEFRLEQKRSRVAALDLRSRFDGKYWLHRALTQRNGVYSA